MEENTAILTVPLQQQSVTRTGRHRVVAENTTVAVETRHRTVLVTTALTTGSYTESGRRVEAHRGGGGMGCVAATFHCLMVPQQSATRTLTYRAAGFSIVPLQHQPRGGAVHALTASTTRR